MSAKLAEPLVSAARAPGERSRTVLLSAFIALFLGAILPAFGTPVMAPDVLRQMNIGKAELENGDYAKAIVTFGAALEARPDDAIAARNLSRALLFDGKFDQALAVLERVRTHGGELVATEYLIGLVHLRKTDAAGAIAPLEQVARLDPFTAAVRYQLAKTYEALGREPEAIAQYRETVRLDPQHAAAHFELAMYARQQHDLVTYRDELRVYKRLRDAFGDPQVSPVLLEACVYTQAEAPALSLTTTSSSGDTNPAAANIHFVDGTVVALPAADDRAAEAIAPLAIDAAGRYTYFILRADGSAGLIETSTDGVMRRIGAEIKIAPVGRHPVIRVGHFHDSVASEDRLKKDLKYFADIFIVGDAGARLLERSDASTMTDVTEKAGLSAVKGRDACWVDFDGDGDLDLAVASETGLSLWQNDGNGHFVDVTAAAGVIPVGPAVGVAAADLDGNGGVDLVAAQTTAGTHVYENRRAGRFQPMAEPPGPWPKAGLLLIDDLDNDGVPDVVLVGIDHTTLKMGRRAESVTIAHPGFLVSAATLIDYDNDGRLDFCAVGSDQSDPGRGRIRIWRNTGSSVWREVTADLSLDQLTLPAIRDVLAIDYDGDGDSDLLLTTVESKLVVLRNDGGNARGQLKLSLTSLAMLNHGGIGSTVEIRAGATVIHRIVTRELPIEIGVGDLRQLDSVQVVWPDGTVDNRIDVPPTGLLEVKRLSSIATGSCPYLYAWDGKEFRFITDFLGSGALGLALNREITWPPDPDEIVRIGDAQEFRPRDGHYALTITSELREVDYFDSLKLMAVDHPAGVEVNPTDSFMPPPVTPSAVWAAADAIPLMSAHDSTGLDVTAALQQIDGKYALPGEVLPPPLRGVCRPITYTLDFGAIPTGEPLVLVMTGMLQFGTASSNIALSQTDAASLVWPTLESETADGRWEKVPVNIGIPDGRDKTHVCDLSHLLPVGTRRLRLTTTFQVYWDRIALMKRHELPAAQVHEHAFASANLAWRGFSRMQLASDGYTHVPVFSAVTDRPLWLTTVEGWCTRYGDVRELLAAPDGKIAVLNGGDALTLECPADVFPPIPAGMVRTFFLAARGWDKEENANTVDGNTVTPLPGQPPPVDRGTLDLQPDWTQRFNTRWVPRDRFAPTPPPTQR
ncbi:MAG: FG-GAP-like repeat-containing protein [Lacunisphaera sp.]